MSTGGIVKNTNVSLDDEDHEFNHGPLRVLTQAVKNNDSIIISLRNGHKLICTVKAFDKHCNMVLENVKEMWSESGSGNGKNDSKSKVMRERFVSKMFLRGDSVVVVLRYMGE
ncbi:mRNA splicing protein [Pichia kluyveri]|uniref:Small nuclear ribonucleoprotein Sm D2 n=1 Tax=Pichia kluyveri TaxID=36015 RepID=A0AAV5R4T6_PICKL|nr:mRNA splicing protein [Pichia kluyveri]